MTGTMRLTVSSSASSRTVENITLKQTGQKKVHIVAWIYGMVLVKCDSNGCNDWLHSLLNKCWLRWIRYLNSGKLQGGTGVQCRGGGKGESRFKEVLTCKRFRVNNELNGLWLTSRTGMGDKIKKTKQFFHQISIRELARGLRTERKIEQWQLHVAFG